MLGLERIVHPIAMNEAKSLVYAWHYSDIFPPHCLLALGFRDEKGLAGVSIWGWGTRPLHTIRCLFPSLTTADYLELCRLCLRDDCPANSESAFIAASATWIRRHCPTRQLLFTWADGIRGKPGYIYQASNWLYGGFIVTEIYVTPSGEPVHPRLMITRYGTRARETWMALGLTRIRGKQFRYVRFLCSHAEQKALLRETTVSWNRQYPKNNDLVWWIDAGEGSRETRNPPRIERSGQFRHPALISQLQLTEAP